MIESELCLRLPDDMKFLMGNVLELDSGSSPWSTLDRVTYEEQIDRVLQGILFDVEHANLWLRRWGSQPRSLESAQNIARQDFASWPKLFPVFGRFLAVQPNQNDNPIFSVMQSDIICYGANLAHYLLHEFGETRDYDENTAAQSPRHDDGIWSDFAGGRNAILAWPSGLEAAKAAPWRVN